jgi:RecJ-like exonuclease
MTRAFHSHPADEDPAELLRPENQVSTPWGAPERGPCEKCEGEGKVPHRCLSCLEAGAPNPVCPACGGRVEWEDVCPSCEGDGEVTRIERRGIASFPTLPGLRRYLADRDADLRGYVFVELEGELSPDRDLDADEGAILVLARRVVGVRQPTT